ncbi:MAG: serine hydrolase, partial [Proteobacteria bacterium]|nr:serine hydrolase [Pseudomonadota bacterium]
GFKPPQKFMAFILELTFDDTRQVVTRERAFDYKGTSSLNSGWNPASAVKIFAAIAALRRIDELGFTSRAKVTFNSKKPYSTTVGALIEAAIINSDNIAYNRVVQLASFDKLHKEILTGKFGISQTALNRAYEQTRWKSLGEDPSLRVSPEIVLTEGKKTTKIPAANSKANAVCSSGACTSLQDLAESSRRLMLQEQLPESESFNLRHEDLLVLRRAMRSADRTRGTEMVDRFAAVFNDNRVKFYSKPGFSEDWFTDNVYIFDPRYNQAWIVVMSGYPGRSSLNSAATAIAKIISSGKLRKIP